MRTLQCTVPAAFDGRPLKHLLRGELGISSTLLKTLKWREGAILLNGASVHVNAVVRTGDTVTVVLSERAPRETDVAPLDIPLAIVYEDEDLLVVNKGGQTPVHPSQGHHGDTLANFLMAYYKSIGLVAAFHPVNRLDRGTSGLMAVAKHPHAHEGLQRQLQEGRLTRTYLAVCQGVPDPAAGIVEAPIGREPGSVLRRMVTPDGAFARTRYEVVQTGRGRSLVQLKLDTGRTHQIRVHMAHLGCPLVGDFLYGRETEELPDRFALHSASIRLEQPVTGEEILLEAPLPRDLADLLT